MVLEFLGDPKATEKVEKYSGISFMPLPDEEPMTIEQFMAKFGPETSFSSEKPIGVLK